MITLYSYPDLYGLEDNNPYGLKVFAFLRLCGLPFEHRHVLDTKAAPRGQLPYLIDGNSTIGDSDAIVAWLTRRYALPIDASLTDAQRNLDLLLRRTLDDLYWSMSYSRWRDDRYWPAFRDALLARHPEIGEQALETAREYNFNRYHYQGIGRYATDEVYARGVADLRAIAQLVPENGFLFDESPASADAAVYGFVANIYYYDIETPLKQFVVSQPHLVRHCIALRDAVARGAEN